MQKPDYGIDAPGVIRNFILAGIAGLALMAVGLSVRALPSWLASTLIWAGACTGAMMLLEAMYMVWSSRVGKLWQRDLLIEGLGLSGDEVVLDVGCGRGLLLIGAAKRLPRGKAFGIDLWQAEDLSGNNEAATLKNAEAEGIRDRVELLTGDMRKMPFNDGKFDRIISSMAIHNIYDEAERKKALQEIVRVLKPGGRLALQDFRHTEQYAEVLSSLGLAEVALSKSSWRIFPPVRVVTGRKNA